MVVWEDQSVSSGYSEDTWKKTHRGWRIYRRVTKSLVPIRSGAPAA
jgi:hypothetical protein